MKKIFLLIALLSGTLTGSAQIQNLQILGHLPFSTTCAGVWHYVDSLGNEYALIGAGNGLAIVDVTIPATPTLLFTVPANNSLWREVKTYGHYAYTGTEGGGGITIIDLSDLPNSYTSQVYTGDGAIAGQLNSSHTVQVFDDHLYIFGSNIGNGGAIICSLVDPWNPTYVGIYDDQYVHDGYVYNDTLYSAEVYEGQFAIVDVTDKSNPFVVATQETPGAFCHNTWFSDDYRYLYTTDEQPNSPVGVFDLLDKQNIQLVETFFNDSMPSEEVHNVYVFNDYLINPSYGSQLTIVDAARPENLIEIARHPTGSFLCWDANPYLPSGNIIATDVDGGFYVFAPYYVRACYLEGNVTDLNTGLPINGATVKILATTTQTGSSISGDYKTGTATGGTFDVEFSKAGYITEVVSGVILSSGNLTVLDVQLESLSVSGQVVNSANGQPVPFAHVRIQNATQDIEVTADANGDFLINNISSGSYDFTAAKWGWKSNCLSVIFPGAPQVVIPIEQGIYDDFTFDFGWTVSGNAADGMWALGEPIGTVFIANQANPDTDASLDCSDKAWVTGNGGGAANDDDVDDGSTQLTSPVFNLTGFADPYVHYTRWFYEQFSSNPSANDTMFIALNNGLITENIEVVTGPSATNSTWLPRSYRITDFLTPTTAMNISITISDKPGSGNPLEGGFDHFFVTDGPLGMGDVSDAAVLVSYPNPFHDILTVELGEQHRNAVELLLTDVTGRVILSQYLHNQQHVDLKTGHLNNGFYLLSVRKSDGTTITSKIIRSN